MPVQVKFSLFQWNDKNYQTAHLNVQVAIQALPHVRTVVQGSIYKARLALHVMLAHLVLVDWPLLAQVTVIMMPINNNFKIVKLDAKHAQAVHLPARPASQGIIYRVLHVCNVLLRRLVLITRLVLVQVIFLKIFPIFKNIKIVKQDVLVAVGLRITVKLVLQGMGYVVQAASSVPWALTAVVAQHLAKVDYIFF